MAEKMATIKQVKILNELNSENQESALNALKLLFYERLNVQKYPMLIVFNSLFFKNFVKKYSL